MEFLDAAFSRTPSPIAPDATAFRCIFDTPEFQETSVGKALAGKSTDECIEQILRNNNMSGFLLDFLQKSSIFDDTVTDAVSPVKSGVIRPLFLADWDAHAKQYLAILDSDTAFMENLSASFDWQ